MLYRLTYTLLLILIAQTSLRAQSDSPVAIHILANEKIADVNIDQDKYVADVGKVLDIFKSEFDTSPADQKVALVLVSHKIGKPDLSLYARPSLPAARQQAFLNKIRALNLTNTKLVDFPIAITTHVPELNLTEAFSDFHTPAAIAWQKYKGATLKEQYELNKAWAASEVLPVLGAFEANVDDKFAGVKAIGNLVATTDFSQPQNITALTSQNSSYWRGIMEMNAGNPLVEATRVFMLVSQGQFDYAERYLKIAQIFSDSDAIATGYLRELARRMQLFDEQLYAAIQKGSALHDAGNFKAALAEYKNVLAAYPNSAWALYEVYYSQAAQDVKAGKVELGDRHNWDIAKKDIYKADPLYHMDVRASNGREGYLLFQRQSIKELFHKKGQVMADVATYADIALDLGVYDFAAQLYWHAFTFRKTDTEASLKKLLYCLEQCGVTDLKHNFKGDYDADFAEVKASREKAMKQSDIYKTFEK